MPWWKGRIVYDRIQGSWAKIQREHFPHDVSSKLRSTLRSSCALSVLMRLCGSPELWMETRTWSQARECFRPPRPPREDWLLHGQELASGPMSSDYRLRALQWRWLQRLRPQANLMLQKALKCHPVAPQRQEVYENVVKKKQQKTYRILEDLLQWLQLGSLTSWAGVPQDRCALIVHQIGLT